MDEPLEQLAQRLKALDCLFRPTRRAILESARAHFTPEDLQRYLHNHLELSSVAGPLDVGEGEDRLANALFVLAAGAALLKEGRHGVHLVLVFLRGGLHLGTVFQPDLLPLQ